MRVMKVINVLNRQPFYHGMHMLCVLFPISREIDNPIPHTQYSHVGECSFVTPGNNTKWYKSFIATVYEPRLRNHGIEYRVCPLFPP